MEVDLCEGDPGAPGLVATAGTLDLPFPSPGDCIVDGVLSPLNIESAPVAVRELVGRPERLDSPAFKVSPEPCALPLPFFDAALASG